MEMLGPLCNQTVNLETDAKTLYYSLLKKKIHTQTGYSTPKNLQIDGSFLVSHRTHTMNNIILCLWGSLCASGRRTQSSGRSRSSDKGGPALQKEFFRLFGQIILVKK